MQRRYLTFWHWSSVTPYTSSYEFAGSCVFGKQLAENLSLRPHIAMGQALSLTYGRFFAEFLEDLSLVRLTLLELITCVGLRYGFYNTNLRSFSRKCAHMTSLWRTSLRDNPGVDIKVRRTDLPILHMRVTYRNPITGSYYYPSSLHRILQKSGNINPVSIGCGFHHPLRPD